MPFRYLDEFNLIVPSFDAPEPIETPEQDILCDCCEDYYPEYSGVNLPNADVNVCNKCLKSLTVEQYADKIHSGDRVPESEGDFLQAKNKRYPSELMQGAKEIFADYLFNLKNQ